MKIGEKVFTLNQVFLGYRCWGVKEQDKRLI